MLRDKSYYDILGVSKSATKKDIDQAYRSLVMKYHPDVCKSSDADAKMKEINKAYEVLSNPEKKSQYDAFLAGGYATKDFEQHGGDSDSGFQSGGEDGDGGFFSQFSFNFGGSNTGGYDFDFKNLFSNFFGGNYENSSNDRNANYSNTKSDINISIELTINEWFNGINKVVTYDIYDKCKACVKVSTQCNGCGGRKYLGSTIYGRVVCNNCGGTGKTDALKLCGKCESGVNKRRVSTEFRIMRFMQQKYVIKGSGHFNVRSQSYGNLIVSLKILEHPQFKIDGLNIRMSINIGVEEFIYGANIKFKYLDNSMINISLPPFGNLEAIIPKKGITENNKTGNLIVKFIIVDNIGKRPSRDEFKNLVDIRLIVDQFVYRC